MLSLLLVTLACGSGPAGPSAKEPPMAAPTTDFCANALALLDLEGGNLETCTPALPDQYWVVATRGKDEHVGVVVVDGGIPDARRGLAAGAGWLRRIHIYDLDTVNIVFLAEGLQWLDALPEGFKAAHLTDHEDRRGTTRFSQSPFRLELRMIEVPVVPEAASGIDLGEREGPGGIEPQRRAILTGDADYHFTWTIERRELGGAWQPVSVIPCE